MNKKIKFLIIGRTASGKSSIAKEVCKRLNLEIVKSYTTRPMRAGEEKSSDHIFINESEVSKYKNDIAAYTEIKGNKYFTIFEVLRNSDVYVIDPMGVKDLKERCGDEFDFIEIYIRAPYEVLKDRYLQRGESETDFEKRWNDEDKQFSEYEKERTFHYNLRNDREFDESVYKVCSWIAKEMKN